MAHSRLFSSAPHVLVARGGSFPPPEVIAKWPAPNYINPEERGWGGPVVLMVLLVLTLFIYVARIRARYMSNNVGIDDVLMSVAMLPVIGVTISIILGLRIYGFQWHIWDQTPTTRITFAQITLAIELLYMVGSTIIKVSILFLYRRLAGSITTKFIYAVWACMAFCIASFIAFIVAVFFTCSSADKDNNCGDEGIVLVTATAVSTFQDLIISFLPIFLIRNLQMPKRQKLALGGIFGLGLLTTVCGIMRTYYLIFVYYYTYDVTWHAYYGWIWTVIESDFGVICASVPALRVYFRDRSESTGGRTSNSPSHNQHGLSDQSHVPSSHESIKKVDVEADGDHVVLQTIVVQRDLSSSGRESDGASQKSDSSTRNLTTYTLAPLRS